MICPSLWVSGVFVCLAMLIKALVVGGSSSDPSGEGRVELRSSNVWDRSLRIPVVGNAPLNEGDVVFVDVSNGYDSPLVLGRSRDGSWSTHASDSASGYSVLWESVSSDGSTWGVAYTVGSSFVYENSSGFVFRSTDGNVVVHDGSHRGVVNIASLESFMQAVLKDLVAVGSGTNTVSYFGKEYYELEDKTFTH